LEYLCPKHQARKFANSEITNQELIDKSQVLVNGVRIALDLQLVEQLRSAWWLRESV
jgi:hypothetical protein